MKFQVFLQFTSKGIFSSSERIKQPDDSFFVLDLTSPAVILGGLVFLGHISQGNLPRQHRQRPITAQHLYSFERLQSIQKMLKETEQFLTKKDSLAKAEIVGILDGKKSRQLFGGTYPNELHDLLAKRLGVVVNGGTVPGCYTMTEHAKSHQAVAHPNYFKKDILKVPLQYAPWIWFLKVEKRSHQQS